MREATPADVKPSPRSSASGEVMVANRLGKNVKRLRPWAATRGISCFRVYDADLPEYAVAIDLYESWVHVQEYEAPATINPLRAASRLRGLLALLPDILGVPKSHVVLKIRQRKRGLDQYSRFDEMGIFHEVPEGNCRSVPPRSNPSR